MWLVEPEVRYTLYTHARVLFFKRVDILSALYISLQTSGEEGKSVWMDVSLVASDTLGEPLNFNFFLVAELCRRRTRERESRFFLFFGACGMIGRDLSCAGTFFCRRR
jgi:hypothetical protein